MTGQRISDGFARSGANPYASGAQAQEMIDRGKRRTELLSQNGISTEGVAPWTDPNWRAKQQAEEDAERARLDRQQQDWRGIAESQRPVAGPGGSSAPVSGYGNYLDKPMFTAPVTETSSFVIGGGSSAPSAPVTNPVTNPVASPVTGNMTGPVTDYTTGIVSPSLPETWTPPTPVATPGPVTASAPSLFVTGGGPPTPSQIANTPNMGVGGIGLNLPAVPAAVEGLFDPLTNPVPEDPNSWNHGDGGGYAMGGIATLAAGGYPRRTGQISGPGTEKSDSIPAMLSDGEFVMTAKAVRGAGKGSRRAGAKQMYKLMHQLEQNSQRG
jgi:hypothetical protein